MLKEKIIYGNKYLRTLDSSVSKSILKRIPTETRVWYTAFIYFESGMTNSDGLALPMM
jgi:hypothetical protein